MSNLINMLNKRFNQGKLKELEISFFEEKVDGKYRYYSKFKGEKILLNLNSRRVYDENDYIDYFNNLNEKVTLYQENKKNKIEHFYKEDFCRSNDNGIEFALDYISVHGDYLRLHDDSFELNNENYKVKINQPSSEIVFSFFESEIYEDYFFNEVLIWFNRALERRYIGDDSISRHKIIMMRRLFPRIPYSANVIVENRDSKSVFTKTSIDKIKNILNNCFYSILVNDLNICFIFFSGYQFNSDFNVVEDDGGVNVKIPNVSYDSNLISFYKNALISNTSGHKFLSFYHVLEYNFLTCVEKKLHQDMKGFLSDVKFKPNEKSIDKLLSLVKQNSIQNDENKMLLCVLKEYILPNDLLEFWIDLGKDNTIKACEIYGEKIDKCILTDENILFNFSRIIKSIRNGIVHSSDKYNRSERYIPFSGKDEYIKEYLPIMRFLAEKIIAGTAVIK